MGKEPKPKKKTNPYSTPKLVETVASLASLVEIRNAPRLRVERIRMENRWKDKRGRQQKGYLRSIG